MVMALDMFGPGMKYWVFGHFDAAYVVTKHDSSWLYTFYFSQNFPYPDNFLGSFHQHRVLCVCYRSLSLAQDSSL
jgi:hypothetical protein